MRILVNTLHEVQLIVFVITVKSILWGFLFRHHELYMCERNAAMTLYMTLKWNSHTRWLWSAIHSFRRYCITELHKWMNKEWINWSISQSITQLVNQSINNASHHIYTIYKSNVPSLTHLTPQNFKNLLE